MSDSDTRGMIETPPRSDRFVLRTSRRIDGLDIRISGRLDRESAHHLEEMIAHLVAPEDRVFIDFTEVTSIDTVGLDALIRSSAHARAAGAGIILRGLPARAHRLLVRCGVDSEFGYADLEDELLAFHAIGRLP